ncbi:hypothetical protein [Mesorhizobium kowhaii]|uniref:hypothetical protein n=1 Tax=Mesorhizobium kowhaii TaxID=1300272 RepID=UPI00142D3871|nr:hypothetical protein [Mesorhizobium kowhaii]
MNSFSDLMVFMPAFKKGDIFAGSSSGGLSIGLAGAHQATLQCERRRPIYVGNGDQPGRKTKLLKPKWQAWVVVPLA